ncbi:MAG: ATP-binding protein [Leptospiraceae bacterium]|nr:ATP-binding protein [Leptospiraceae bacterium]
MREKFTSAILKNLPEIIFLWNYSEAKLIFVSENVFHYSGIHSFDLEGKTLEELQTLIYPEDIDLIRELNLEFQEKSISSPYEIVIRFKNISTNEYIFYSVMISEFYEEGFTSSVIGIARDITSQKKQEEMILHSKRMESLGNFASSIAHDFNNMLQPIFLFTGILKEDLKGVENSENLLESVNKILETATKSRTLVQQILNFSRKPNRMLQEINIYDYIKESIKSLEIVQKKDNLQIETYFQNETGILKTDPIALHQVIMNLFNNSIYATKNVSEPRFYISVTETEKPEEIRKNFPTKKIKKLYLVEFTDNGTGIPEENLTKIFEPFFTDKKKNEGTGLGLSIVFGIIQSMNGKIEVKTELGKGTSFIIQIPELI